MLEKESHPNLLLDIRTSWCGEGFPDVVDLMELIVLIAIGLTIWRVKKYFAAIKEPQLQPSLSVETSPKDESSYWIPPGKAIVVNGYRILVGGLYVGTGLSGLNGLRGVEPALIDPKLPIDRRNIDKTGKNIPYWPSYSNLPPGSRAGYLEWLASDLEDGQVHVGYPFLFLYGLERRLLDEARPFIHEKAELDFMQQQLTKLLKLYGKIDSFERYATSLLEIVEISRDIGNVINSVPPVERAGDALPARTQVAISQCASAGRPLPAEWALSWVMCHPELRLRMAARRCTEELRELFRIRYSGEFGDGVEVRSGKGVLALKYRPASPSFGREVTIQTSLPQVPALRTIPAKLVELVDRCTDELDAYSRRIANCSEPDSDLRSIALLPKELVQRHQGPTALEFRTWIEEMLGKSDLTVMPGEAIIGRWAKEERLSRADSVLLSQLLEKWNYGVEPDVRFGGPTVRKESKVVLFRLSENAPSTPSPEYELATVLLHLGMTVAMADRVLSNEEERRLEQQIEVALKIAEAERGRLVAHLRWLCIEEPTLSGMSKRLAPLDKTQRAHLAQSVITLAGADGYVRAEEVEALAKIYSILGMTREQLHLDLHALSMPESQQEDGLVTVQKRELLKKTYQIPEAKDRQTTRGLKLDMEKVNAKLSETAVVSAMLAGIFSESDPPSPLAPPVTGNSKAIGNLDAYHSKFLAALVEKTDWERSAIEELAASLELLPDGALEVINEASFDTVGEALWEGDDLIRINTSVAKEMMTCQTSG